MKMTPQAVNSNNELIAKFLGWEEYGDKGSWYITDTSAKMIVYSVHNNYPHTDLHFHRSWDWLMPVIEKIEKLNDLKTDWENDSVYLHQYPQSSDRTKYRSSFKSGDWYIGEVIGESKIESAWLCVIEFIKWYN